MGQAAKATIELAHALLCEERLWVLNEKRLVKRAGLTEVQEMFSTAPRPDELVGWISRVRGALAAPR